MAPPSHDHLQLSDFGIGEGVGPRVALRGFSVPNAVHDKRKPEGTDPVSSVMNICTPEHQRGLPPFSHGRRSSGVLLHVTSLPSPYGIGDLGPAAHAWVDQLHDAGQTWWQALPLGPTGCGNSPYSALSSFAGNLLIVFR